MFETLRGYRQVVKAGRELAVLMLSRVRSWEEHVRWLAATSPHLVPGLLVQQRIAIDDLKIGDDTRVALIDSLGLFRDSVVARKGSSWEETRVSAVTALISAQRSNRSSAKQLGALLARQTTDPLEAAVFILDAWNVLARMGAHLDGVGLLDKAIRGAIIQRGVWRAQ